MAGFWRVKIANEIDDEPPGSVRGHDVWRGRATRLLLRLQDAPAPRAVGGGRPYVGARPSSPPLRACLDGLLEFLDRVAERLLLDGAADRAWYPEADVDRL